MSVFINRSGVCAICGDVLGFYDSKWIEKKGDRLICVYNRKAMAVPCDLQAKAGEPDFSYYTDG